MRTASSWSLGLVAVVLAVALLAGCQRDRETPPPAASSGNFGGVTATVVWPSTASATGGQSQPSVAPAGVFTVELTVDAPDMAPVTGRFSAALGGGIVGNVPEGAGRTLTVRGLTVADVVTHVGFVPVGLVLAGETSDAGIVTMDDVTTLVAPGNVTGVTATPGDRQVFISWTNPPDDLTHTPSGVMIRRSTSPFTTLPVSGEPTEGTLVFDDFATSAVIGGLTNGTEYHFALFVHDPVPNYAGGVDIAATPNPPGTDVTAPTVTSHSPPDLAPNVALNTVVSITFDEPMNQTATQGAFSLAPTSAPGSPVAGSFTWTGTATPTMIFTPSAPLTESTNYTVTLTTAAEDLAATPNPLASTLTFTFTTISLDCKWDVSKWGNCKWGT